jgi:pyruvate/2-oxoglutarate dehydrogenase complex dihydrolipoamide acyltransferase (E2) component
VTDEDVRRTLMERSPPPTPASHAGAAIVPLTGKRGEISLRMHKSLQNSAQLNLMRTLDVTALGAIRESLCSRSKVSYNDLIVRAAALALRQHPALNATRGGRAIHRHDRIHLGYAALEEGLIVPIVRDADHLSLHRRAPRSMQRPGRMAPGHDREPHDRFSCDRRCARRAVLAYIRRALRGAG